MLIIAAMVNAEVTRILVDQGTSANILFREAFDKLELNNSNIGTYFEELIRFTKEKIRLVGYVPIHITLRTKPMSKTLKVEILVINCSSTYNAIIGHPTLNQLGAIVSTNHLTMKFSYDDRGIITVRGDQAIAKCWYNANLEVRPHEKG